MEYAKWDALGNVYLVVERDESDPLTPARVTRLCDSRHGPGSDGVLEVTVARADLADVTVWNPDGSIAETSGNGLRIAARWLSARTGAEQVELRSSGRTTAVRMLGDVLAESAMGTVTVGQDETLLVAGEPHVVTPVSVGNPHAVIRLDGATRDDLLRLGPLVERHERFPDRTNVQLVEPVPDTELRVLVWERGAGETASSGSSAVAAASVAVARGWCRSPVTVQLPGGVLFVSVRDGAATLVGPAVEVDRGTVEA